ncbi:MAG: hypothetical protein NZ602_06835 [Thermoguttaceae bacterium]|nr:hypothetical protein [Thermoguttaceae bacterium]MDW8037291.1 hypothetical protein [Thermoguttaceae bacterium]
MATWADRLWYVSYVAHIQGEGVGLYEILAGYPPTEGATISGFVLPVAPKVAWQVRASHGAGPWPVPLAIRRHPASIVGTHANRMIHQETQQLLIGPYLIDAKGQVRVIKQLVQERLTGTMRHLSDPEGKVYYLAMEGAFYEVDLASLQVRKLFELSKELGIPARVHFKGAYTAQGRVVVANNSYFQEDQRDGYGLGRLAEWDGQRWTILRRTAFCDVTTAASFQPTPKDNSTLWANGWDRRSVLLCILHQGQWHTYRLPKASQSYDHAWCTEWPRIRPIGPDLMLLDMHGLYYKMSPELRPGQMAGLHPYAAHLKMTPDFCIWQDRLVLAGNENSSMNHRHRTGGQPQSNLWFGTLEEIGRWGRPSGWGGPWLDDLVGPDTPSDPFLVAGFDHRCLHLAADSTPVQAQCPTMPATGVPGLLSTWQAQSSDGPAQPPDCPGDLSNRLGQSSEEPAASANGPGEGFRSESRSASRIFASPLCGRGRPPFDWSSKGDQPSLPTFGRETNGDFTSLTHISPPAASYCPTVATSSDKPIQVILEVDPDGSGQWKPYLTLSVPLGGYRWHVLPRSLQAVWMRLRVDRNVRMSAQFHFAPAEPKAVQPELFAQLPLANPPQIDPITRGPGNTDISLAELPDNQPTRVQINGALLPFADRLWFCAYRDGGPGHKPEPAGLYEITESLQFIRRPESVPGIFSNRLMVGGVPGYLSIGPHLIAADGSIRTIAGLENEHLVASVRLEEASGQLAEPKIKPAGSPPKPEISDPSRKHPSAEEPGKDASGRTETNPQARAGTPKQKLGLLTAAGRLLEVDLSRLAVQATRDIPAELGLPGRNSLRFQAAHTVGNTLIVAAVGQGEQLGLLAEHSAGQWRIIDRAHYAEVCNLGSMSEQVVAVGWDAASTILMLRTPNGWQKHRLPKASENYPPPGADYSPRIREVVTERLLLDAGGLFYEVSGLPYAWSIRPITTHNRRIADFCSWRGLLVLAGCQASNAPLSHENRICLDNAKSGFQNGQGPMGKLLPDWASSRGFRITGFASSTSSVPSIDMPQPESKPLGGNGSSSPVFRSADGVALWFGTVDDLWLMGKIRGVGGPWLRTPIQPHVPSDPYLMCHFDQKRLELEHDAAEPVEFTVEVDFTVQRNCWHKFTSLQVPPGQKLVYEFPEGYSAHWVRLKADRACRATARFVYQ